MVQETKAMPTDVEVLNTIEATARKLKDRFDASEVNLKSHMRTLINIINKANELKEAGVPKWSIAYDAAGFGIEITAFVGGKVNDERYRKFYDKKIIGATKLLLSDVLLAKDACEAFIGRKISLWSNNPALSNQVTSDYEDALNAIIDATNSQALSHMLRNKLKLRT